MKKEFICLKLDQHINQQLIFWAAKGNMPLGQVIRTLVESQVRRAEEKKQADEGAGQQEKK